MIICSLLSRFCTLSTSSRCSAKAIWEYLEISMLSSGGLEMAIATYHSRGELIYHFFKTAFLQSIFDLSSSESFEKLSSLWFNNAVMIVLLLARWLFLLFLLYHISKSVTPRYHMFLLLHILHLFLFKSLQRQGELSIYADGHIIFWWDRDGNYRLSFLKRADLPFVRNIFFAIHFWPIFICQFRKVVLFVIQQCSDDYPGQWS